VRRSWSIPGLSTREKLVELLSHLGFEVHLEDIWEQSGDYRKNRWGGARWGAHNVQRDNDVLKVQLCSWDTMTQCVRYGITVERGPLPGPSPWEWEVTARR
jgi:hypothetical protein